MARWPTTRDHGTPRSSDKRRALDSGEKEKNERREINLLVCRGHQRGGEVNEAIHHKRAMHFVLRQVCLVAAVRLVIKLHSVTSFGGDHVWALGPWQATYLASLFPTKITGITSQHSKITRNPNQSQNMRHHASQNHRNRSPGGKVTTSPVQQTRQSTHLVFARPISADGRPRTLLCGAQSWGSNVPFFAASRNVIGGRLRSKRAVRVDGDAGKEGALVSENSEFVGLCYVEYKNIFRAFSRETPLESQLRIHTSYMESKSRCRGRAFEEGRTKDSTTGKSLQSILERYVGKLRRSRNAR